MTPKFRHTPLQSQTNIRILKLLGNKDKSAEIVCNIIEYPLQDGLEYEAMSYTWQNQVPGKAILCDDQVFTVTANCEAALRRFRPSANNTYRFLWIDQICIDQDDASTEKSAQVGSMGSIYGSAKQVLIFLLPVETSASVRAVLQARNSRVCCWLKDLAAAADIRLRGDRDSR